MKTLLALGALLATGSACRRSAQVDSEQAAPAAALASASPSFAVVSQIEAAGVRVRTGTLPALGASGVWGFTELEPDLGRTRLEIELGPRGAPLAELLPKAGLAVVNGGYFEADFRPSTWLKNAGVELGPKSDTSKGGVLALGAGQPYVGPFAGLDFEPALAVQSFPLLVEPDAKPGIRRDDGRRAARTVVCMVARKLRFIVISAPRGEGPTLFETSELLRAATPRGFGCRVALNLDGGPSSGVWFGPAIASKQRPPLANVGYAIAILPR
jgi:hypothetical protein